MSRAIQAVNMNLLTGVVNHMAPAGQRMPELTAITLLEQSVRLLIRIHNFQLKFITAG
jgi:hypothetical protein